MIVIQVVTTPQQLTSALKAVGESVVTHNISTMKAKPLQTPLKFLVLLLVLLLMQPAQAQSSCDSALVIQMDTTVEYLMSSGELWLKFQATSNEVHVLLFASSQTPRADINSVILFGGNCQNLIPMDTAIQPGLFKLSDTNLVANNYYYIRVNSDSIGFLFITIAESIIIVHEDTDCPEDPCNNLLGNGDFEETSYMVVNQTVSSSPNPHWAHPFNFLSQSLNGVYGGYDYQNLVCRWRTLIDAAPYEDPFSQIYTPTIPSITQDISGQYAARLFAKGSAENTDGKPITNRLQIFTGNNYEISFNYKIEHGVAAPSYNPQLKIGFTTELYPTSLNSIQYIQNPSLSVFNSTIWTHESFQFTAAADFNNIIIHSHIDLSTNCYENRVYIDDICIKPLIECPIVEGPDFTCNNTTLITYNITNYFPGAEYYYSVNGSLPIKIIQNPFTVDITNVPGSKITVTVTVDCKDCPYEITTYISCDPATSLPVTMDYTYKDGDVISQSLFTGENIFICGHVTTGQDITIWDCNVYFAPLARLTVSPSTTLTLEYSNLTNGCDYFWDGVFAEDETSSIIVRNNTVFSFAKNAIVSANNSGLDVTNAEFTDNLIGIHIRQYNPYYLPANPDGSPFPPPHNAYIASSLFEMVNATAASQFLNEWGGGCLGNPEIPPMIGIRIDTVYNITIGDDASIAKRNYFDNLTFGIHAIWSDLTLMNGQFDNIGYWCKNNLQIDQYYRPREGAIHCIKPKLPSGMASTPMFNSALSANAIIGGAGLKACHFNNCRIGIYAYKNRLIAEYNQFNEQNYNAVLVDEGRHNCKVNFNTISMKDGLWAPEKFNNISILFTRAVKPLGGINTEIIGNTIYNTRIGIYALSHSSNPQATCVRCTKIGSNQIYFNNTLITDGSKSYYGIELLNGDYARVAGNHIENQATAYSNSSGGDISLPPQDSVLTGINVAQSKDAWIYDNHQIIKMSQGIRAVGVCLNTQFSCNDLINCRYGFYFYPSKATVATVISQQGWSQRASDNYWVNNYQRIDGELNMPINSVPWYFRGDDLASNPYSTIIPPNSNLYVHIIPYPNTDVNSTCVGLPFPGIGDDPGGEIREMRYGDIVRENLIFDVLEEEFEQMSEEYLYEILYTNPDVMNIGQPGDTLYQNFYNYLTNSTIAEFTTIRELMDEENFAQALLDNGQVIATTMIDQNRQLTNDIYLRSVAVDAEIDSADLQALLAIALLTPYIGGDGVYAARAMLGIDADDYGLAYRKGNEMQNEVTRTEDILVYPNPANDDITFEVINDELLGSGTLKIYNAMGILTISHQSNEEQTIQIPLNTLKPGIYYYHYNTNSGQNASGRFIKK